jgi:hypothetical protein
MKTFTITAVLGALVAIPFLFGRRKSQVVPISGNEKPRQLDSDVRYDVDDFLSE